MKHDIIKTDNYLLIVSDEIPTTWYYDTYLNKLRHTGGAEYGESSISKKVIGHLPINNSPILEGVDLLPPLEDDVEKLALINAQTPIKEHREQDISTEIWISGARQLGFKEGYNKAKEKYKYTEEDMRDAYNLGLDADSKLSPNKTYDTLIQSLQQPKYPIGFECELYETQVRDINTHELIKGRKKTTTNSQGQTVLEGKYIYE
jgi:hypothetical protein